jgi:hypothetical protein
MIRLVAYSTTLLYFVSTNARAMSMSMSASATSSPKIAVIGAGAAGLSTARILSRQGAVPTVLEKDKETGGVWRYIENSKTTPMYRGLRTNLPKEVMAFREKPWTTNNVKESFITHKNVADYLHEYERDYDLTKYISFDSPVKQLTVLSESVSQVSPPTEEWPRIRLEWEDGGNPKSDDFDAVFICNGHYAKLSTPVVPGLDQYFEGDVLHSVTYDDPSVFAGKTVLCVGGRASGSDLAREISLHADHVYLSDTTCPRADNGEPQTLGKVTWVPKTMEVLPDGTIRFDDDCVVKPKVDTIVFCSGYDYSFPFINDASNLELNTIPGERRVMPLYEQLWHARYPNLAFIGLPHSVVPFPFFELQAEAVWKQCKTLTLPSLKDRLEEAEKDANAGGAKVAGRIVDTHFLGSAQWDYCRKMAKLAGIFDDEIEAYISTNKVSPDCMARYFGGKTTQVMFD